MATARAEEGEDLVYSHLSSPASGTSACTATPQTCRQGSLQHVPVPGLAYMLSYTANLSKCCDEASESGDIYVTIRPLLQWKEQVT